MSQVYSRRDLLKLVPKLSLLPVFPSLYPQSAFAQSTGPKRLVVIYFPDGTYGWDKVEGGRRIESLTGREMGIWHPADAGPLRAATPLPLSLSPLENNRGDFSVISGLNNSSARFSLGEARLAPHPRASSSFLTCSLREVTDPAKDIKIEPSMDQVLADHFRAGGYPGVHSLALCPTARGNFKATTHFAYMNCISYRKDQEVPVLRSPGELFQKLYVSVRGEGPKAVTFDTVVDYLNEQVRSISSILSAEDRIVAEKHLDALTDFKTNLSVSPAELCPKVEKPSESRSKPFSEQVLDDEFKKRLDLMFDMVITAFQCDILRVVTIMLAPEEYSRVFRGVVSDPYMGVDLNGESHNDFTHHQGGNRERVNGVISIDREQVSWVKTFIDKLKSTSSGGGNLFDDTLVVYGSGLSDGQSHSYENLPLILAGGESTGLKRGQHFKMGELPVANLHLSILQAMGMQVSKFGDSTTTPVPVFG